MSRLFQLIPSGSNTVIPGITAGTGPKFTTCRIPGHTILIEKGVCLDGVNTFFAVRNSQFSQN